MMKAILPIVIIISLICFNFSPPVIAADTKKQDTSDLSEMDWSDDPEEESLSQESWADEAPNEKATEELSEMSWENDEGENEQTEGLESQQSMSKEEGMALDIKERRIHIFGFLMFIGYIVGALLTGYFSRNRKLAVEYPPELLILLHTVWPLEWVFMLFAGKKVR